MHEPVAGGRRLALDERPQLVVVRCEIRCESDRERVAERQPNAQLTGMYVAAPSRRGCGGERRVQLHQLGNLHLHRVAPYVAGKDGSTALPAQRTRRNVGEWRTRPTHWRPAVNLEKSPR